MKSTYNDFRKENRMLLFGHEDAGKEDDNRLSEYYFKTNQYEDISSSLSLQVVVGEKGTGKSALLKMAFSEDLNNDLTSVWLRLDDLSELYGDILEENNLYKLKTLWKRAISKVVIMKLASSVAISSGEDYEKALQWAYQTGYASRDFISRSLKMLKPIYEKYIDPSIELDSGERGIMERMLKSNRVRLYLDDFDLDWKGNKNDINMIKSLLLSLSDMTSDMDNFSVRIALRTDVYDMIRTEEFSDKFETSLIRCNWNNQQIMCALAKRISTYFELPFDIDITTNSRALQYKTSKYFDTVFCDRFRDTHIWKNAPTSRVIYSLIRRKPRDMVKLCHNVAEQAYNKKMDIIESSCFINVLESYSQERFKDLINEYKKQVPKLSDLLVRMAPTRI